MAECSMEQVAERLKAQNQIAVLCHASPDGDTIGCAAALVLTLRSMHKQAEMFCADPIPKKYDYFMQNVGHETFEPAYVVSVDVADAKLLGALNERFPRVNLAIDHHASHRFFADETWLDGTAVACAILLFRLLNDMQITWTRPVLDALYTGLSTDSGCFRYPATTPEAHRMAAFLIEKGADFAQINRDMFETKSRARVQLEKLCMDKLTFYCDGTCALSVMNAEELAKIGAEPSDFDGVAALPRQIEGVNLGVMARQVEENKWKISTRSNQFANAQAFCRQFGGGGHFHAAGCTLEGTEEQVSAQLLDLIQNHKELWEADGSVD